MCWRDVLSISLQLSSDPDYFCELVNICYQVIDNNTTKCKLSHCSDHDNESFITLLHIELLAKLISCSPLDSSSFNTFENKICAAVTRAMLLANKRVVGYLVNQLLPVLIGNQLKVTYVNMLWESILTCYNDHGCSSIMEHPGIMSERPIFLICGIADILFPATGVSEVALPLLLKAEFWQILQSGFFHQSSLTRKRSLYLLKRILDITETQNKDILPEVSEQPMFWWTSSLKAEFSDVWMNFILLTETLEETQIHVIRPLMPRFQLLVNAASRNTEQETDDWPLLHTSWLLCLVQRAATHDNSHVQRWIVQQILELDFKEFPVFSQGQSAFFCGPFVKMLSVSNLYHRPSEVLLGDCPPVAQSLLRFFDNVSESMDDENRVIFFRNFLTGLLSQTWGGGPLVYVVRGLTQPSNKALVKDDMISTLRDVMLAPMSTLQSCFRSAVQYYLMVFVTKSIDLDSVTLNSFCSLLGCLRGGEVWTRGTDFYQLLVTFLCEAATKSHHWNDNAIKCHLEAAIDLYINSLSQTENKEESTELMIQQSSQIVRLLVLAFDGNLIKTDKDSAPLCEILLTCPLSFLYSVNTHAYISMSKVHRSLVLIHVLIEEVGATRFNKDYKFRSEVGKIVFQSVDHILLFIQRQVTEVTEVLALTYIDLYSDFLMTLGNSFSSELSSASQVTSLVETCIHTANRGLKDDVCSVLVVYSSVRILSVLCQMLYDNHDYWQLPWTKRILQFCQNWHIIQHLPRPRYCRQDLSHQGLPYDMQIWGRTASRFIFSQWRCLHAYMAYEEQHCPGQRHGCITMDDCLTSLDLTSGDDSLPILQCMAHLFTHESEASKCQVIGVSWQKVQESLKDSSFWPSFDVFLDMLCHSEVLNKPPHTQIGQCINQLLSELFSLGEEKGGIVYKVVHRLCQWAQTDGNTIKQSVVYIDKFIGGLIFGPVHSRGKRFVNEVVQFLGHQKELPGNELLNRIHKVDAAARVQVLSFIAALDPHDPDQREFLHSFICHLIVKYKEVAELATYRNYINSLTHRHKHRLFVALLLLQPVIDEEILPEVFSFLQTMLASESQPSLRYMAEWMIILLINKWSHLMEIVWNTLSKGSEKKPAYLCSLLTIVTHVSKLISTRESQITYLDEGLKQVFPWCMAHQFNVRTFGQTALFSLWQCCKENHLESLISQHSIIQSFINFTESNRASCKSIFKLLDNFLFKLHPLRDYSIETLVHTLPMLTGLTDEEWIPLSLFTEVDARWYDHVFVIPLYNTSEELKHSKPGTWKVKGSAHDVEEELDTINGDVQKKMIPWRMMLPETELNAEMLSEYSRKQHQSGGLILVTSLIDKIPNLGGLCRTAEIFAVSEFVIGNLAFIEDQGFKSLSVSAHHWIPVQEVFRSRLRDYLMEKKFSGYTIVGAEQTAQSQCLTEYNFPKKSVLLLGNEKEGIPVDLIQLLDACVEIPQQGITRSLNVHVSGALLIWEYTRQQLLKSS